MQPPPCAVPRPTLATTSTLAPSSPPNACDDFILCAVFPPCAVFKSRPAFASPTPTLPPAFRSSFPFFRNVFRRFLSLRTRCSRLPRLPTFARSRPSRADVVPPANAIRRRQLDAEIAPSDDANRVFTAACSVAPTAVDASDAPNAPSDATAANALRSQARRTL